MTSSMVYYDDVIVGDVMVAWFGGGVCGRKVRTGELADGMAKPVECFYLLDGIRNSKL